MACFKALSILVLALFCFCCSTDNQKTSGGSGKEKKKLEGLVQQFRKDGTLATEITYKDKKRNGLARAYYKNGKLKSEINYKDDLQHGLVKMYYENGKLFRETIYKEGKIDGIRKTYRENGKLLAEVPYLMDEPGIGTKEYTADGKLKKKLPEMKVEFIDNLIKNNEYIVRVSLTGPHRKVDFYTGELTNGKFKNNRLIYLASEGGVMEYKYKVPPGSFIMESLNIIAETQTAMGIPYLVQQKVNIAFENKGY